MNPWTDRTAPTLDDFEEMAAAAWAALPQEFRDLAGNVPCMVSEFPDEETMREKELETENARLEKRPDDLFFRESLFQRPLPRQRTLIPSRTNLGEAGQE